MNENNIDITKLRLDLMEYYGTAMFSGFPMGVIDLNNIENASELELIEIAKQNNFDLNKYLLNNFKVEENTDIKRIIIH